MSIELRCTNCDRELRVEDDTAGKRIKCPQCHFILMVPGEESAANVMTMTDSWYMQTEDGRHFGPVPRTELNEWVEEGRVSGKCQLLRDGDTQWKWAGEIYTQLGPNATRKNQAVTTTSPATRAAPNTRVNVHGQPAVVSERSRVVAGLLGLLLPLFTGICGVQRFYTGHIVMGLLMLFTVGGCFVWQLIDVILIFSGSVRDVNGLPLRD